MMKGGVTSKLLSRRAHQALHPTSWMLSTLLAVCPGCYLALILGASQVGLAGVLIAWFPPFILFLIAVSLLNYYLTYRYHGKILPLVLAGIGGVLFVFSNFVLDFPEPFMQVGGILLFAVAALIDINSSYRSPKTCDVPV